MAARKPASWLGAGLVSRVLRDISTFLLRFLLASRACGDPKAVVQMLVIYFTLVVHNIFGDRDYVIVRGEIISGRQGACDPCARIVIRTCAPEAHLRPSLLPVLLLSAARSDDPSRMSTGFKAASLNSMREWMSCLSRSWPGWGRLLPGWPAGEIGRGSSRSARRVRLARRGQIRGPPSPSYHPCNVSYTPSDRRSRHGRALDDVAIR